MSRSAVATGGGIPSMVEEEGALETRTWEGGGNPGGGERPPSVPPRWRPLRRLGKGGQAEVWLAEDRELGERVALKLFGVPPTPEARERWRREVHAGRALRHPGLVRIYDLVEHDGGLFAVMEPVLGGTLADRISQEGPLPVKEVVRVAEALLDVLAYLHRRGIVHRDVKPSNVLFEPEGGVRLGDLGLTRRLEGDPTLTRTAAVVGTPAYMAPEQLAGGEVALSWDLYALGVTLYEALTGERPFSGDSAFAVADGHLHHRVPRVRRRRRDCPRWLARFVERLLEKRPEDRWPSAEAALAVVRRRRVGASPRVWRRAALGALAVVVAAATVYAGMVALRASRDPLRVEAVPHGVVALDGRGRAVWRYRTDGTAPTVLRADLLPLPGREVVVLESLGGRGRKTPVFAVLDARGRELYREPFRSAGEWPFPVRSWQVKRARAADVDGDGFEELVTLVRSETWYPAEIFVLDREEEGGLRNRCVMCNSGALDDLTLADVNGDGVRDLVVGGLNNPMGFLMVAAAVDVAGLGEVPHAVSPDLATDKGAFGADPLERLLYYTAVAGRYGRRSFHLAVGEGPGGFVLGTGRLRLRLDRWGNPEGYPLAGRGPAPRARFWRDLVILCGRLREQPDRWRDSWRAFREAHREVLAEPGSDIAASLMAARALADEARHRAAAELLAPAVAEHPDWSDPWLRRGEYLILAGDRAAGRAALVRSTTATSGRNAYDAQVLLALDAALAVDPEGLAEAVDVMRRGVGPSAVGGGGDGIRCLLAFSRGEWTDPLLLRAVARPEYPWIPWLRLWAEVAGGVREPAGALEEVRRAIPESEAPELGRLLEAELLRRLGNPGDALVTGREALHRLEVLGRRSLEAFAWVPLAHWEVGRALAAAGRGEEAAPHLREASRLAPRTWYGRAAARLAARGGAEDVE